MAKMFTVAGTSVLNGVTTFRFATGTVARRVRKLTNHGHTEIKLADLPQEMTKTDAMAYLQKQGITAVMPVGKKDSAAAKAKADAKAAAEAAERAKKDARNAKRREQRAKARAEKAAVAAADELVDGAAIEAEQEAQQDSTVTQ